MMLEKIKKMIAEQLGVDEEAVTPEKTLKEDLNADSLDLFELVKIGRASCRERV